MHQILPQKFQKQSPKNVKKCKKIRQYSARQNTDTHCHYYIRNEKPTQLLQQYKKKSKKGKKQYKKKYIMICTSSQYFSRKQKIRLCKNSLKNQVVKLAIFVLICVLVGSLLGKGNQQTSYTFYYAQKKIVNKHTRGVFPPLNGDPIQIFGCWRLTAKIGSAKMDLTNFKNYTLCFEKANILVLTKTAPECTESKGIFNFNWRVFSYNLFISKSKIIQLYEDVQKNSSSQGNSTSSKSTGKNLNSQKTDGVSSTMSLPQPTEVKQQTVQGAYTKEAAGSQETNSTEIVEQIKCFKENEVIFDYIRALTVWTIREGQLFLISEARIEGKLDVSILVLDKIY